MGAASIHLMYESRSCCASRGSGRHEKSRPATILVAAGQWGGLFTIRASHAALEYRAAAEPAPNSAAEETEAAPWQSLDPRRPGRLSRAFLGPGRALFGSWDL